MSSNSETAKIAGYVSVNFSFIYNATVGNYIPALLIPTGAYALKKFGEMTGQEQVSNFGDTLLRFNVLSTPGAFIGRSICYIGGGAALAKAAGIAAAGIVTYKCIKAVCEYAVEASLNRAFLGR